jgi:hypothetical protein
MLQTMSIRKCARHGTAAPAGDRKQFGVHQLCGAGRH